MRWEIQSRSRFCSNCERKFLDGDGYRCVLCYRDDQPFRQDFCEECWNSDRQAHLERDEDFISWWWSTVRIPPPQPKEEAIKRSLAEELLRKYLDFPEPKYVTFRYILALMLERRRVLSQKHAIDEAPSGKTILVYEHNRTGETFLIEDPHLSLSQMDAVQAQVKEILDSEREARETQQKDEDEEDSTQGDTSMHKEGDA